MPLSVYSVPQSPNTYIFVNRMLILLIPPFSGADPWLMTDWEVTMWVTSDQRVRTCVRTQVEVVWEMFLYSSEGNFEMVGVILVFCALDIVLFASNIWAVTIKSQIQKEPSGLWQQRQPLNQSLFLYALWFTPNLTFLYHTRELDAEDLPRKKSLHISSSLRRSQARSRSLTLVQWSLRILEYRIIQHLTAPPGQAYRQTHG